MHASTKSVGVHGTAPATAHVWVSCIVLAAYNNTQVSTTLPQQRTQLIWGVVRCCWLARFGLLLKVLRCTPCAALLLPLLLQACSALCQLW
jgi:hypothetical protein